MGDSEELSFDRLAAAEVGDVAGVLAGEDPWRALGYTREGLRLYLARRDPGLSRMAVRRQGTLAAVLAVRHPWLLGPFVELLAVLPGFRGSGIGRAILQKVESNPSWAGRQVWVTVSEFNSRARAFYRGVGYEEVARLPEAVTSDGSEILLRKALKA